MNERAGLYVIPDTPMPTSRLLPGLKCSMFCFFRQILLNLPIFMLMAGSMLLDTVKPSGDEMGLSIPADSAGLMRRSCILPAGLLMLRILAMWLILMGGAPLLGSATLPQCPARAKVLTKLATGLVSCAELWLCAAATCVDYIVRLRLDVT